MVAGDVLEGTRALERADWEGASRSFSSVLETADVPEARDGLGLAKWFLGRIAEGIAERERAFEGLVAAGRCDEAARIAVWVAHQHLLGGRASASRGWLARAERCLEGAALSCAGRGWVAVEHARHAVTGAEQVEHARRALTIAREHLDGDLEVAALSLLGRAVVLQGHREEGLRLLEEAMAAATSGRVRNLHTLGEAYCNLIDGCATAGEWERGAEWCEFVEDFARTHRVAPLFGACRTVHARLLVATGQWTQAEDALQVALATSARTSPQMGAPAVAELAELRVRQGRLLDAERLLADRETTCRRVGRSRCCVSRRAARGKPPHCSTGCWTKRRTTQCGRPRCWRPSSTRAWRAVMSRGPPRPRRSWPDSGRRQGSGSCRRTPTSRPPAWPSRPDARAKP